jgi:hypothetical protein
MKINIWCIESSLHSSIIIDASANEMIKDLHNLTGYDFEFVDFNNLYKGDLALIFIKSGGSENLFLKHIKDLKSPYYLLTYGHNNSLAASLEILTYLHEINKEGEILHGSNKYIATRLTELLKEKQNG